MDEHHEPEPREPELHAPKIPWWTAAGLAVVAVLLAMVITTLQVGLRQLVGMDAFSASLGVSRDAMALGLSQLVAFGITIFLVVQLFHPNTRLRDAISARAISLPMGLLLLGAGFALQFPFAELGNVAQELWPISVEDQTRVMDLLTATSWREGLGVVLALVLIAPVAEEVLFRGLLLPGLAARHGWPFAIAFSALLFGVSHGSMVATIYASVAGVLFAILRWRSGSVIPGIVLHAGINAVPVLLPPSVIAIDGFNVVSETPLHLSPAILVVSSCVACGCFWLVARFTASEDPRR